MTLAEINHWLERESEAGAAKPMAHFGIRAEKMYGIKLPALRKLAKEIGKNNDLAAQLWNAGHHEGKLLATLIAVPGEFSLEKADSWIEDIYSWDVCDQLCINLLSKVQYAWELPARWAPHEAEYERRVGIVMIAVLAVHHKKVSDGDFLQFLPLLKTYAADERNFVKKAVNWAVRQLGKRSAFLHPHILSLCHGLLQSDSRSAKWIANDALKELQSEKIKARLNL